MSCSKPCILLRSSWQVVNIGDIAHTPGVLALLEKHVPEAEVILWASDDLSAEVADMEHKRFPSLQIVKGSIHEDGNADNPELAKAISRCDFLLHGSGPFLVAHKDIAAFVRHTGKPFGVFGISFQGNHTEAGVLNQAKFAYFRDSASLALARRIGVHAPVMEFGPDGAFAVDLRDDGKACAFMEKHGLAEGKFVCCIPKLRNTPYWRIRNSPFNEKSHLRNEEMKEHDHAPHREAITEMVRATGMKVLLCPEDMTQMEVGKEMILDKLPSDVLPYVVWRDTFWLTDEALSVYVRSAGLFGNEMHSPIMCVGNGIPAIVCRWEEQTSKGLMWRDIGLGEWLFDFDQPSGTAGLKEAVLDMVQNPAEARERTQQARRYVENCYGRMMQVLRAELKL